MPVRALRVTYVGELGWELYCPAEFGAALWRTLWSAGEGHGLVAGGYRAIDSLRLEKGYRVWGADITPDEHPFQAGLGLRRQARQGEFIGREALLRARDGRRGAAALLPRPRRSALGRAVERAGDASTAQVAGRVTSGGYGYTVGASIAYAYLPPEHAAPGTEVAVEIFGEWVAGPGRARAAVRPRGRARAVLGPIAPGRPRPRRRDHGAMTQPSPPASGSSTRSRPGPA